MTRLGGWGVPGSGSADLTTERELLFGGSGVQHLAIVINAVIDGSARDSGNTPTNVLRPGLVLGKITASGKYKQYDPAATDGSEVARAIKWVEVLAQDFTATNADRVCPILIAGPIKAGQLIGLDAQARQHLANQFLFDDDYGGQFNQFAKVDDTIVAAKTVTAAENGTEFQVTGGTGVTFTLPTVARGLRYKFRNRVNQNMIVASAVGDIMETINDATADSVEFSTANEKTGASVEIFSDPAGAKWLVDILCPNTVTVNT